MTSAGRHAVWAPPDVERDTATRAEASLSGRSRRVAVTVAGSDAGWWIERRAVWP
jgi:hypothetical protein